MRIRPRKLSVATFNPKQLVAGNLFPTGVVDDSLRERLQAQVGLIKVSGHASSSGDRAPYYWFRESDSS